MRNHNPDCVENGYVTKRMRRWLKYVIGLFVLVILLGVAVLAVLPPMAVGVQLRATLLAKIGRASCRERV